MKKALVLALTGICAVAAFATESDPSNTVGFINQTTPVGTSAFSACPIGTGVALPASGFIAGQGTAGDKIYKRVGAAWVSFNWSPNWTGLTFDYNSAYLYQNNSGSAQSLVVAGPVVAEGTNLTMGTFGMGLNGWGNPLPLNIDLDGDDMDLVASGFASGDRIYNRSGAAWVGYTYNGAVFGLDLMAGEAYLVQINSAPMVWNHIVGSTPAAVVAPACNRVSKTQTISALN